MDKLIMKFSLNGDGTGLKQKSKRRKAMTTTKTTMTIKKNTLMTFPNEMTGGVFLVDNKILSRELRRAKYVTSGQTWFSYLFSWTWFCKGSLTTILPLWTEMGQVAHSAGQVTFTCHLTRDKSCQKYLSDPGQTYTNPKPFLLNDRSRLVQAIHWNSLSGTK